MNAASIAAGPPRRRLANLDLLRGLIVFVAPGQHYAGYLSQWYTHWFRELGAMRLGEYAAHADVVGRVLPLDAPTVFLNWLFTPWTSQLYLTLAAFNLANRDRADFAAGYGRKLRILLVLFLLFTVEEMIVSQNFGQMLTFSPLQAWMVILAVLATLYRYGGVAAVAALFVVSWTRFVVPVDAYSAAFEGWMRARVHPGFAYDAALHHYLTSGALGFLLGYAYQQRAVWYRRSQRGLAAAALLATGAYVWVATGYTVDASDVYRTEHFFSSTALGLIGLVGLQMLLVMGALALEERGIRPRVPVLRWIGENSLVFFFLHKIVFLYVLMPFREAIGQAMGVPVRNNLGEILMFAGLAIASAYAAVRLQVFQILGREPKR